MDEPRRDALPGLHPDPRWSLANERTLLAYQRTSIALVVAGLAVAGSNAVADAPAWLAAVGLPLVVIGALLTLASRRRFLLVERAVHNGEPLPPPRAALLLPWGIAAVAALATVLVGIQLLIG